MQHHALAVEDEHDNRPLGGRLARRRVARLVEGVEILRRTSHQLTVMTGTRVAHALDRHRAEGRLDAALVHAPL